MDTNPNSTISPRRSDESVHETVPHPAAVPAAPAGAGHRADAVASAALPSVADRVVAAGQRMLDRNTTESSRKGVVVAAAAMGVTALIVLGLVGNVALGAVIDRATGSGGDFCAEVEELDRRYSVGDEFGTLSSGGFESIADDFHHLADSAPGEIAGDIERLADALDRIAAGQLPDIGEAEADALATRIDSYATEHCLG